MDLNNLTEADAMTISRDPSNEFHGALFDESHANHGTVKGAVEKAFARANPERDALIRNDQRFFSPGISPADVEKQILEDKKAAWDRSIAAAEKLHEEEAVDSLGEPTGAEIRATEELRQEHGLDFDQFIADGSRGLEKLFAGRSRSEVVAFVKNSGILENEEAVRDAMRLLAKIGKARR